MRDHGDEFWTATCTTCIHLTKLRYGSILAVTPALESQSVTVGPSSLQERIP